MSEQNRFSLDLDDRNTIEYSIAFSIRRNRLAIVVYATGKIEVRAPMGYDTNKIPFFLSEKSTWIIKQLSKVSEQEPRVKAVTYENGTQHLFLGELYTLNIISGKKNEVRLDGNTIYMTKRESKNTEKLLLEWYLFKANELIPEIIALDVMNFFNYKKKNPKYIFIKIVKSYWGICTYDGIIRLNAHLIKAKKEHIRYIINHELCHLVHRNHSSTFYNLLSKVYPSWKECKEELNSLVTPR